MAGSRKPGSDAAGGRLLVATPALGDPNFSRTVVLMLEHTGEGALGLVLNRPSGAALEDPLPQWRDWAVEPAVVFVGGPVRREAAICLARTSGSVGEGSGWRPLFDRLGTLDLGMTPDDIGVPVRELRIFAGYSSWGPGQLEGEIDEGAWYVVDTEPGDALSADPEGLWRRVLKRQPGVLSTVANFPLDVTVN